MTRCIGWVGQAFSPARSHVCLCFAILFAFAAAAQVQPARKAAEYPGHASTPRFDIGAEYLFHSLPTERGALFVGDYIVIEVAIYPAKQPVVIEYRNFVLRMNGRKILYSETPGFVGASIKYPDWETPHSLDAQAQVGPVIIGQQPNAGRFPGDPNKTRPPYPPVSKPPDDTTPTGEQKQVEKTVDQYVTEAALPDGETAKAVKGCMFFQYTGMLKSIKSLDLVYDDGKGARFSLKLL